MDYSDEIQHIRQLIAESDTDIALEQTRALLKKQPNEAWLANLDLIESEYNDLQDQRLQGVLSTEEQVRYYNITKAKLLALVLKMDGEDNLSESIHPAPKQAFAPLQPEADNPASLNARFKNGLKNTAGVLFFMSALGSIQQGQYAPAGFSLLGGAITFVPTLRMIEKIIRYELLSWHKYAILIGSMIAYGAVLPEKRNNQTKESEPKEANK